MKFRKGIMVWNRSENLQMLPTLTKERPINVVDVRSIKGEVESGVGTKEENTESKKLYAVIVIHRESIYRGYYMVQCKY